MNGLRTLAVDPGRSMIGIAVFEGASLLYYALKTLRVPGTPEAVRSAATKIISSLIATYHPSHVVIEQPLIIQQRAILLAHVISALKATARQHNLPISDFAPHVVRSFICRNSKPTKRETALELTEQYPELSRYIKVPGKWAELYYERLFGAVAVGFVSHAIRGR